MYCEIEQVAVNRHLLTPFRDVVVFFRCTIVRQYRTGMSSYNTCIARWSLELPLLRYCCQCWVCKNYRTYHEVGRWRPTWCYRVLANEACLWRHMLIAGALYIHFRNNALTIIAKKRQLEASSSYTRIIWRHPGPILTKRSCTRRKQRRHEMESASACWLLLLYLTT